MTPVESLWIPARSRFGSHPNGRRRPTPGITAVLDALAEHGPTYVTAIAALAGQSQGNVSRWLIQLEQLGFVQRGDEVAGLGNQGGGRPAVFWSLTGRGWALVRALADELVGAA